MATPINNVVVNQTTSIIQRSAFQDLFSQVLGDLPANSNIDLEINIGQGTIMIEESAFQQLANLPNGITIRSATLTFDPASQPTLAANFASGLQIRNLTLPSQTTLQPNALVQLPNLQILDASQIVNPIVTNGMNLERNVVTPLIVLMPSSPSATFSTNSVIIPQSGNGSNTTLVFDGNMPPTNQLSEMFGVQPQQTPNVAPAPIGISVNFSTTSNVENNAFASLTNALTVQDQNGTIIAPVAVQFNAVQALVQQGGGQNVQNAGVLADVSQFAGDYFDYVVLAPKNQNDAAINQCVVTSLSEDAKKNLVQNIPIPSAITPANSTVAYNVTGLVSNMKLNDTTYYIVDNYLDPSDISLPKVPTVAIFSKANANVGAGNFFPALVCSGTIEIVGGSVRITGPNGGAMPGIEYCKGYNQIPAAQGTPNQEVNLLNGTVGTTVQLYDRSVSPNINPIGTITYPDQNTFSVQFNPTMELTSGNEPILGCMQNYRPTTMVVSFTNISNTSNAAGNMFKNRVANLIANNNALASVLNQIQAQGLPAGVTVNPAKPTPVSILAELAALSKSDFNNAYAPWIALENQYNTNYSAHLTAMQNYVTNAIAALSAQTSAEYLAASNAFKQLQTNLVSPLAAVRADFALTNGVRKLYAEAVKGYINTRLSLGLQTFKSCNTMVSTPHFGFLHNISKINDELFYFCSSFKEPIIIPSNVGSIGTRAFYACSEAIGIDIQDAFALRTIGDSAFYGCSKASGNLSFSSSIFHNQPSVEHIGNNAFNGCANLSGHIYFPSGFKSLGVSAFENCSSLNGTIVFPSNVSFTAIPANAFASCSSITGISTNTGNNTSLLLNNAPIPNGLLLPVNITQIGANAFLNCSKFAGELNLTTSAIASIGNAAFKGCAAFTSLVLPTTPSYNNIAVECFRGCSGITNLVLPNNVTQISANAFEGCNKIATAPKFDNVNFIGDEAFKMCSSMAGALVFGADLNVLGNRAFFDCVLLTSATFLGPPPSSLKSSELIFGVTAAASTPFHVNVFTENGWDGTSVTTVNNILNTHTAFRSKQGGVNSRIQIAFIDFNTFVPTSTPREITINNYQSFNVYENDTTATGGNVVIQDGEKLWNDVYIPSTLAGESLTAAQTNVNQAPLLQSQVMSRITPNVDVMKTSALDMSLSANAILNTINGSGVVVRQIDNVGAITLHKMTAANNQSTANNWYGIFTNNAGDNLYYAAQNNSIPDLVARSVISIGARSFFVNADAAADDNDFKNKYNNKVIHVGTDGVVSISSNITAIGYGLADQPTAVRYTSVQPTTDRTGKGYSIVKSAVTGVADKLYFDTLIAAAGTYFVSKVSTAGTVNPADAIVYNGNIIEVREDGSVHRIIDSRDHRFVTVPVANAAALSTSITVAGQYGIITNQQSGANTQYQLLSNRNNVVAVVPAGYYYIRSSDIPQMNNAIVLVHPNGGISAESAGVSGTVARVEDQITSLAAEQIPIYATNANFQNTNHIMNVYTRAHNNFNSSNQQFKNTVSNHLLTGHAQLQTALRSDIQNAITGLAGAVGTSFKTAFTNLDQLNGNAPNATNELLQLINTNLSDAVTHYNNEYYFLNELFVGSTGLNGVNGLQLIQSNTLTNQVGMYAFRRNASFNSNALNPAVNANDGLTNDLVYITSQIDKFLTEILKMQHSNQTAELHLLFNQVKTSVLFQESPTVNTNPLSLTYDNLSLQQRILFDFVTNFITLWFNSETTGSGGQKSWGNPATLNADGTKLYSVPDINSEAGTAELLQWGKDNILAYFIKTGVNVYTQFLNNVANIATFDNIRVSISAYETARLNNNTDTDAQAIANKAYIAASKVVVTNIAAANSVSFDDTTAEPTAVLDNGKLRFNNADQTQSTKLFVSLNDGQATPVEISFAGYADTIMLNDNIEFRIYGVTKNANCFILDVAHVAGTGAANSVAGAVTFVTYQNASIHTLGSVIVPNATVATMNKYVYEQYHNTTYTHTDTSTSTGIKAALTKAKTDLHQKQVDMVNNLNLVNNKIRDIVQGANVLNSAEDNLIAKLHATPSLGTTLVSNGAILLHRELQLTQFALQNSVSNNSSQTPLVGSLSLHEESLFQSRVAAFWNDNAANNVPASRMAAYTTANNAFVTAQYARQTAAIRNYVANALATQNISSPVTTSFIRDQAQQFSTKMLVSIGTNTNQDVARLISAHVAGYVLGRSLATAGVNGDALIAKRNAYQDNEKKMAAEAMRGANVAYGTALYNRYVALVDLAISKAYYAGLPDHDALAANASNAFQTSMLQWHAASSTRKLVVFSQQIKALLYDMVYTTDATGTYTNTTFPLKDANANIISWFGDNRNGFLNRIVTNGLTFANQTLNGTITGGLAYSAYELPQDTSVRINNQPLTTSALNTVTMNGATRTLITSTSGTPSNPVLPEPQFASAILTEAANSTNPLNIDTAANEASSIASLTYDVAHIGYSSLPSSAVNLAAQGFTAATGLNFTVAMDQSRLRYQFQSDNKWHHGFQQSSSLANSWKKLSSAQDVVIFYPSADINTPTNLDKTRESVTALCDDATFVMIIESVADSSSVKSVSIYRYDVWGIQSGDLIAIGTLTQETGQQLPTSNIYNVSGALQKIIGNPASSNGVNLVGDLVISAKLKTIGIRAFSSLNRIKTLTIADGGALNIGSNAFESCDLLSAINLGSSVKSVGPSAFRNCTGAASLALPPASASSSFVAVNHWAFLGCNNIANDVQLPSNLMQINVQSFAGCTKLRCSQLNETLPASVQKIGLGAFFNCKGLVGSLNFNSVNQNGKFISNIRVLGAAAFMGCTGLNGDLVLPDNAEYVNVLPYTFASISAPVLSLSSIIPLQPPAQFANSNPMSLTGNVDFALNKVTTIERSAFYQCNKVSTINLSNAISLVGIQSFLGCTGLKQSLLLPASVKSVGEEAFKGCSGLTGLNIVSTMVSQATAEAWLSLGQSCFQDCTSLATSGASNGILIPSSVNSIGDSAFQGCTSMENVSVGSGLTKANSFGSLVFSGCTKLARVTLAFSFLARDIAGQSVVKGAQLPVYNASFTGCTALGVPSDAPAGTIQIQSGATGWTPGRAEFFNRLTIIINNKNITFYLKEFNDLAKINVVDPSTEPLQQEAIPPTDAQATVHIKASDMRKVFLTSTDSFVTQDADSNAVDNGQLFFVRPEYFPQYLNVANAQVVQGGIESYNAALYEQLVKDDVMRYYAMTLFNSADWVTLFANDTEMLENMVASSGLMPIVPDGNYDETNNKHLYNTGVLYNIMQELEKVGYVKSSVVATPDRRVQSTNYPTVGTKWWGLPDTVLPEQGNIGKKLFSLINRNDPNRISSMVLNGATPSELPFLPGDQFVFVFTLNENSVALTPGLPPVVVKKRTYLVRMILTDDFVSGDASFLGHFNALYTPAPRNLNILPVSGAYAADYMYSNYNLHLAIKPAAVNQTANSVYSRITQNSYEPIPMPVNLLPFTGWYYAYPYNSQTIRLDFTPPDLSLTNKYVYRDLRYLSAYVYFPENWSSVSVLPNRDNFPQWVLTFSNGPDTLVLKYRAEYLPNARAETVNFLGQTVPFDFTNTHVQLICPFDNIAELLGVLAGQDAAGNTGTVNTIASTHIYRQRSSLELVSGLRKTTSKIGPFTYPPIARGYQGINMSASITTQQMSDLRPTNTESTYHLQSITLDINMSNNDGFVPSVIVKSVEVVAKNYESYYLAPLNPN